MSAGRRAGRGTALRRFWRNRLALAGAVIVAAFLLGALCAPLLSAYSPTRIDLPQKLLPPTGRHLLGTDELGAISSRASSTGGGSRSSPAGS